MSVIVILCASSLLLSAAITPLARNFALRTGFLDAPDGRRKLHRSPVPNLGGIPLLAAFFGSLAAAWVIGPGEESAATKLAPSLLLIFTAGLFDDRYDLKPLQKLLFQIIAALAACAAGVRVGFGSDHVLPAWLSWPITVLWLVGCINAINFVDAVDGLAAGLGLIASLATLAAAQLRNDRDLAIMVAPLAAALLGFLPYNFSPARMFLGDSGSSLIGLLLGCSGAAWMQRSSTPYSAAAPLIALCFPLVDVCLAIARRARAGRPIFSPDRQHLQHRLLNLGLGTRRTVLLIYAAGLLAALLAVIESASRNIVGAALIPLTLMLIFAALRWLRSAELRNASAAPHPETSLDFRETAVHKTISAVGARKNSPLM